MKFYCLVVLLLVSGLISSCGDNKSHKEKTLPNGSVETDSVSGKYGIKSGIIEYKSTISGKEAKQTLSFDNYGKKELIETVTNIGDLKIITVSLTKDGYVYSFNPVTKTGTKVETLGRQSSIIDFRNISDEMKRKMNLQLVDTVTIDERSCIKYNVDWVEMSMTGTYTVWKGITIESDVNILKVEMVMTATSITENPVIPPEKFEVPADIRLN
jgi:hypothetical protein